MSHTVWPTIMTECGIERDMTDLEVFEALVLSQVPATQPWTPVTDYSFDARKAIEGPHPQLIKDTFALDIRDLVIDAGCGPDGILVKLLSELGLTVMGFDPQIHQTLDRRLMYGSLLETSQDGAAPIATLVICREVLEHLTIVQIKHAVTHLCSLSKQFVYVTTRFAKDPQSLLDVDTADDLDPTHVSMLNQDLLRVLFILEGFKRRADLEATMDWKQLGRVLVYERAV